MKLHGLHQLLRRPHLKSSTARLIGLAVLSVLLLTGCGWYQMWMTADGSNMIPGGNVRAAVYLNWAQCDDGAGACCREVKLQYRGENRDTLMQPSIKFFTDDPTVNHIDLNENYRIENMIVIYRQDTAAPALCQDTADYSRVAHGLHLPVRTLRFRPVPVGWPVPDTVVVEFDWITGGEITGALAGRRHVVVRFVPTTRGVWRAIWDT